MEEIKRKDMMILISKQEFRELAVRSNTLNILIDGILDSAELNYNNDGLRFDSDAISILLKAIDSDCYKYRLDMLKEEKAAKAKKAANPYD